MSQASFLPGEVVLIPYAPYTDQLGGKPRPCMIVSGNKFNQSGPDVILAPITSNIRVGDSTQVVIQKDKPEFQKTGLRVTSAIKCGAMFAYSKAHVKRRLGRINRDIIRTVRELMIDIRTSD